ncbi:MAG: DNA-processing protein DprA [Desulfitobacteriaceae bacterium]|nr:DNA-processing protein DprA [Desulfitobacteriaceae bacterium]MDD4346376.1 DNA-processing protein DprA [Desulfitobacteriaceae bacterium]MDD4400929.1 DNA-processing protein DprA [Desulfitobacteriaceae bacterium]
MEKFIESEKQSRAAFRTLPGIGSRRLRILIAHFGSAQAAWTASVEEYLAWGKVPWALNILSRRKEIDPALIKESLDLQGISTVLPEEENYPCLLAELVDAPPILYYKGLLRPNKEALAIVGSRRATAYGRAAAGFLSREIAAKGIVIVSGLARGIDTAAHEGALAANGETWAFLGSGLDRIYPAENKKLAQTIIENGALISEFIPGSAPEGRHFPARNRLISGCSRGVVVIEAASKSGALITVDFALEQGREVFAVPGPIFSEMSKGTHYLLRSGAKIAEGAEDIWAEISWWSNYSSGQFVNKNDKKTAGNIKGTCVDSRETVDQEISSAILNLLSDIPLHIDQIVLQCNYSAGHIALNLLELQLQGEIEQLPGQYYVLVRKC